MQVRSTWTTAAALPALLALTGCQSLPGTTEQQAAAAGGVAGAVVGQELGDGALGTLLGGALGAAGGYLIGGNNELLAQGESSRDEAVAAAERARRNPATAADVADADTADLNDNGFVTTDELVAMENAGLSNDEILSRLRATDQVFALSQQQKQQLVNAGVSQSVVNQLEDINRQQRQRLFGQSGGVISEPRS